MANPKIRVFKVRFLRRGGTSCQQASRGCPGISLGRRPAERFTEGPEPVSTDDVNRWWRVEAVTGLVKIRGRHSTAKDNTVMFPGVSQETALPLAA